MKDYVGVTLGVSNVICLESTMVPNNGTLSSVYGNMVKYTVYLRYVCTRKGGTPVWTKGSANTMLAVCFHISAGLFTLLMHNVRLTRKSNVHSTYMLIVKGRLKSAG